MWRVQSLKSYGMFLLQSVKMTELTNLTVLMHFYVNYMEAFVSIKFQGGGRGAPLNLLIV